MIRFHTSCTERDQPIKRSTCRQKELKLLGWIGSCGKNKINLGREALRKPKPVTLDEGEHRKPITEYRKPKPVTGQRRAQETHH